MPPEPPKEENPDYDEKKAIAAIEAKDPYEPILKPLSEDQRNHQRYNRLLAAGEWPRSWSIRVAGDAQYYKEELKKGNTTNGIIVLRSLVWPGAYTLYQNDRLISLYVGYGNKADKKPYYPVFPPLVQDEPADCPELPEPNPQEDFNKSVGKVEGMTLLERLKAAIANEELLGKLLDQVFDVIDVDKSGQIDKKELLNFLTGILKEMGIPMEVGQKEVDEFMGMFDQDHSGTISKAEMRMPFQAFVQLHIDTLEAAEKPSP